MIYGIDEFKFEITTSKYEELCMDLWKKYIYKMEQTIKFTKIDKKDIDEINQK